MSVCSTCLDLKEVPEHMSVHNEQNDRRNKMNKMRKWTEGLHESYPEKTYTHPETRKHPYESNERSSNPVNQKMQTQPIQTCLVQCPSQELDLQKTIHPPERK